MAVFLPGKSYGQRSLAGYSLWCQKELDVTEQLNNNNSAHCSSEMLHFPSLGFISFILASFLYL